MKVITLVSPKQKVKDLKSFTLNPGTYGRSHEKAVMNLPNSALNENSPKARVIEVVQANDGDKNNSS